MKNVSLYIILFAVNSSLLVLACFFTVGRTEQLKGKNSPIKSSFAAFELVESSISYLYLINKVSGSLIRTEKSDGEWTES